MFKTKLAFCVFLTLGVVSFPYYIIYLQSDYLSSIVPGWHTTIIPDSIFVNLAKFIILLIVTIYYWKLSKITTTIKFKNFLIHLLLTIPGVFISRISLFELLDLNSLDSYAFINRIQIIAFLSICINILFFKASILFALQYKNYQKPNTKY